MKTTMINCVLACLVAFFALECVAAESPESAVSRMESRTKDPTRDPGLFGDYWWANRFLSRHRLVEGFKGKTVDVVMLGDSIMHFWEWRHPRSWAKFTKGKSVLNLGYGGDKTENVIWRIEHGELDGYTAKCVVLMVGTNNNSSNGSDPAAVARGVEKIVAMIRARQAGAKLILHPIFPRGRSPSSFHAAPRARNDKTNALLKKFAERDGKIVWVDFGERLLDGTGWVPASLMADEIHPTDAGYDIWMDALAPHISPPASAVRNEGCVRRVDAPKCGSDWDIGTLRNFDEATRLIQAAIDEVFKAGGGRVDVGRGFYPIRGIRLRSGVTLRLESGAVLQASRDSADFDILGRDSVEPVDAEAYRRGRGRGWTPPRGKDERRSPRLHSGDPFSPWHDAIIRIFAAHDVAILGEEGSVIDGANGFNSKGEENYRGVHGISAHNSTNILLRGFTIRHTGNWSMNLRYCGDITCERVTALGGHDGFHARGCDNVRVEDCFLHTGDDAVAGFDNCGMVVRGCDLSSACSAFRIGGRDILIEDCHAHGPCEYVFRGSLPPQAKRDGLWDPATVPGRHSMATFFLYFCDYTMPVRHQPGNIVVRNCTVENAARLVRYNFGGETWQHARPLADVRFENVDATGMWLPVALNAGSSKDGDVPLAFSMIDCGLSFAKSQPEVFSVANVRTMALTNVTVAGVSAPLVRSWDGSPELLLDNVKGAAVEVSKGHGDFKCPPR